MKLFRHNSFVFLFREASEIQKEKVEKAEKREEKGYPFDYKAFGSMLQG
jgi:hypothetical protein